MPRYFFDVTDGRAEFRDETGIELAPEAIVGEVENLLRLLARQHTAGGRAGITVSNLRRGAGRAVFHAPADLAPARRD